MSAQQGGSNHPKKILHHGSTDYGELWIEQLGDKLQLRFDNQSLQTQIDRQQPHKLVMTNLLYLMGILIFIPPPRDILILGVGGGAIIHFFQYYLPGVNITGVDYDAKLLDLAQRHLGLPQPGERLSYVTDDAKSFVSSNTGQYDLIVVDIFDGSQSPNWMLQQDFMRSLKNRLSPSGAIAFNLLVESENRFKRFYQSLRQQFSQKSIYIENDNYENRLLYAFNGDLRKRSMEEYLRQCQALAEDYDVPFMQIMAAIYDNNPQGSGLL